MKYYSMYLDTKANANRLSRYLHKNHHAYEYSRCGDGFQFAIKLNPEQASKVFQFMDTLA